MSTVAIGPQILLQHIGILGKTGSGKTYLAKLIVEQLLESGERVCIIDPTGVWWGLRSNANGTGPGFPVVVFGGQHQDVPLGDAHGTAIAEIVGTTTTPAILDTRLMTVGARTRFFTDFAETLLRKNAGPLHLVIDEAHLFAPQGRVADPRSGQMVHAANNLVSLGRGVGLRIVLISQRPAKLHKDSLTQVETLIAMRLIAPQDRRAVEDWIGEWADPREGKELLASLPSLKTGTGWIWAPEVGLLARRAFPRIKTYDSSRAPTGEGGDGPVLAPIDLPSIQKKLGAVAEEAKANDPNELRKRIRDLEKALADGKKNPMTVVAEDTAGRRASYDRGRKDGYQEGLAQGFDRGAASMEGMLGALSIGVKEAGKALEIADRKFKEARDTHQAKRPKAGVAQPEERRNLTPKVGGSSPPARARPEPSPAPVNGTAVLQGPQLQLLSALAWWRAAGHDTVTRAQLAAVAGWKVTSGHLRNVAGSLRTAALIDYPGAGTISLTEAGRAAAPPPDDTDLRSRIENVLTNPQRQVFDVLTERREEMSRMDLAAAVGWEPSSGHVRNILGSLRTLDVITYPRQGYVALTDWVAEGLGQ